MGLALVGAQLAGILAQPYFKKTRHHTLLNQPNPADTFVKFGTKKIDRRSFLKTAASTASAAILPSWSIASPPADSTNSYKQTMMLKIIDTLIEQKLKLKPEVIKQYREMNAWNVKQTPIPSNDQFKTVIEFFIELPKVKKTPWQIHQRYYYNKKQDINPIIKSIMKDSDEEVRNDWEQYGRSEASYSFSNVQKAFDYEVRSTAQIKIDAFLAEDLIGYSEGLVALNSQVGEFGSLGEGYFLVTDDIYGQKDKDINNNGKIDAIIYAQYFENTPNANANQGTEKKIINLSKLAIEKKSLKSTKNLWKDLKKK